MITGRVVAVLRMIRDSYAFIPGLCLIGGVLAAIALTTLDALYGGGWIDDLPFLLGPATSDGARGMLTTIGGSMLSVAGIVFSITLAAVVFASGQYGPHVIPQYRRDRFAQMTLGIMLSVYAYAMTALYVVQGGDTAVVPRLAIFGALILASVGIVMLVLFISHMLGMLHVSNVIARIGSEALRLLDVEMPAEAEDLSDGMAFKRDADRRGPDERPGRWLTEDGDTVLRAKGRGYVLTESTGQLLEIAERQDVAIDVLVRPGDYVTPRTPLLRHTGSDFDEELRADLRSAFAFGTKRTPDEDVAFLIDELCAIGLRALSPGINDPFTATDVLHQLAALTERAARGVPVDPVRTAEDGEGRVRRPVLTFADVVRLGFDRMATDAAANVTVAPILVRIYDGLLAQCIREEACERLAASAERFARLCREQLPSDEAKAEIGERLEDVLERFRTDRSPAARRVALLQRDSVA